MKTNHICANVKCNKGENGDRKHYYACDYCDRIASWKSLCCSIECYNQFIEDSKANTVFPKRTDKTEDEVKEFISNTSVEEALEMSKAELSEFSDEINENNISSVVEEVNKEIDRNTKKKKRK